MRRREQFAEICIRQRNFGADANARNKAGDHQHCSVDAECPKEGEQRVNTQIHQECGTTPKAIGNSAHESRANKHSEETGTEHGGQHSFAQSERRGQNRTQNSGEENVEEIEKQTEADDDGRSYMPACDRQPVESIRDRQVCTHRTRLLSLLESSSESKRGVAPAQRFKQVVLRLSSV